MLKVICRNQRNSWFIFFILFLLKHGVSQSTEGRQDGDPYQGKYIGKMNSYHHQVSGEVHAVDDTTFLLTNFNYDGNGADTFFWAGASNRPGPLGFIVPNEYGKTNILGRYYNKDFTLKLPDGKKITEIKWLAVYDLSSQNTFGDIYTPDDFDPPATQRISQLTRKAHGVTSGPIQVLDAKTLLLPEFSYDGGGKSTYFWVGVGPQPSSKGYKVPDEYGYLDPIRPYLRESVKLELPGELTIFDIDWFSVFDVDTKENYGSVIVPDGLNVPPSLVKIVPHKNSLPNCVQLHKEFRVSWEVFGPQITIELAAQVDENDYMAFGISGSPTRAQMIGSDVAIAYIDGYRGFANDYNVTAKAPCIKVLGQYKGVCRDELLGGLDDNQMHTAVRADGINTITYRRSLIPNSDPGDKEIPTDRDVQLIWALGVLTGEKEPSFHDLYPRGSLSINLGRKEAESNCFAFTRSSAEPKKPWNIAHILDQNIRLFTATLGPSGGKRGYHGMTGMPSPGFSWYINGYLAPELYLKRGLRYTFEVRGGNDPHSPEAYHPLIITDEPHGGIDRNQNPGRRKYKEARVLAGVQFSTRGQARPTAAGPLCLARHSTERDRRRDDDFNDFKKFNRSLIYKCDKEQEAGMLEITPNSSWPDTVYYNSFTHSNVGWKIHIVDTFTVNVVGGCQRSTSPSQWLTTLLALVLSYLYLS
ncbi:protein Skeletor, isoforms B/C [Hetaerina americana]|uniref:protein Skeletor, isoforms B/C n=1 Tax=Hetaerina americana TaxID=62018 RepID=UPI003A7F464B